MKKTQFLHFICIFVGIILRDESRVKNPSPPPKKWAVLSLHAAIFTLPPSHSPWGMERNEEREKEEVVVSTRCHP